MIFKHYNIFGAKNVIMLETASKNKKVLME